MLPFCHVAMAVEGCGWTSADNIPMMIASTIIGAWDRTQGNSSVSPSRLVENAAKQGGLMSFQSFNTCYKDTGLWGVYFVGDKMSLEVMMLTI